MSSIHITNIAIVGAAGTVGRNIVASLLATGKHNVTALTRECSSTSMPAGVQVAKVDYASRDSLVAALRGQHALIITLNIQASSDNTQRDLISAAAEAGVAWVMPNDYAPDFGGQPEMGEQAYPDNGLLEIRRYIESLGVSNWVSLACSFWYQHCLIAPMGYGFDIANKKVTFFDDGETKITHSTLTQCGRAVAALFTLPISSESGELCLMRWKNRECYISSFLLSQNDMFASILRATNDERSSWTISQEPSYERWRAARERWDTGRDPLGRFVAMITRVFFPDGCGDLSAKLDNELLQLPQEDLDEETKEAVGMAMAGRNYRDNSTGMKTGAQTSS